MLAVIFELPGSQRAEYFTARNVATARATLDAWAGFERPCFGWRVRVEDEAGAVLLRRFWSGLRWELP